MTAPGPAPRLRRSRSGAVLGGVCAGLARSAGLDPLLLRIVVVAVTVLTGGAGIPAYLAAWVLIPREPDGAALPAGAEQTAARVAGPADGTGPDVRAAWTAVGHDLRALGAELRRPADATAAGTPPVGEPATAASGGGSDGTPENAADDAVDGTVPDGAVPPPRSPLETPEEVREDSGARRGFLGEADDAATALGERLRTPEVQAGARRAATSVSQALSASADELGRRIRREPPPR
jgi:phage shock protein PspC (stress-responsive transcriptional regulator)